jgi:glutamine amidotransferase
MAQRVAIIDYGSGNLRSAQKALARAASDAGIDANIEVTANADAVLAADRIVLPGVGAFADCMRGLTAIPGMRAALDESVLKKTRPFLGICVGMQLLATRGLEHGEHQGLNWIPGDVVRLEPSDPKLKVPHMGWNTVDAQGDRIWGRTATLSSPVYWGGPFEERGGGNSPASAPFAYFVHSYRFETRDPAHILATTDYGGPIAAVVGRDNIIGTQFHPEKSQETGLEFLTAFLRWRP